MRLIDADEFTKQIAGMAIINNYSADKANKMCELIDCQKTAYDVDKVVEQLEDLKKRYWFTIANTGDEKLDCAYENVGNALDRAIEIVKAGGVNEQ